MTEYAGDLRSPKGRYALVAARFNAFIVDRLVEGARSGLMGHGVAADDIDLAYVPGSLEIPLVADRLASSGKYAAVICLGCIIRGETDHYDVVVHQSARGIADAGLRHQVPVLNAVLTTGTLEQAIHRAGGKSGNKGHEVAVAAIEMVDLMSQLPGAKS